MIFDSTFSRELVQQVKIDHKDPVVRKQKLSAIYRKFDASEVRFGGKLVGWRVKGDFVCFKRTFKTEEDAHFMMRMSKGRRGYKSTDVYQCPKCQLWHATSQGHLAGTGFYKETQPHFVKGNT